VSINLKEGKPGSGDNCVIFTLFSDGNKLPLNHYHPFDWSLKIEVPNGGVQKRTDKFRFEAPVDGYLPLITYSMSGNLPRTDWKEGLHEDEFFLKLASGIYARIRVTMIAHKGHTTVESFLNPSPTSRNLEYDSDKQDSAY